MCLPFSHMNIQKINWKLNFKNPEAAKPADFFKVLNKWIPDSPEIFIDVADYRHVQDGPWTLLAGYHADFVLDHGDRKLGFLYSQKSAMEGDNTQKIVSTLVDFLKGCDRLLKDPLFSGKLSFDTSSLEFIVNDRALVPNNKESFEMVKPLLQSIAEKIYGNANLIQDANPRRRFSIHIAGKKNPGLDEIIASVSR